MTRDDLHAVLDLGWETTRRASQLLTAEFRDAFNFANIGSTGRDLDQLAYDLRRLGYVKPARLAYSIAFVLNGLVDETIPLDHDLVEKSAQIVSIMADMLLELDATKEITIEEPTELVEHLQSEWGLVIHTDSDVDSRLPPAPFHAIEDGTNSHALEILHGLMSITEQMVDATASLMERVLRISDFPYSPAVTRIHYLATTIRDRVSGRTALVDEPSPMAAALADSIAAVLPPVPSVDMMIAEQYSKEAIDPVEESTSVGQIESWSSQDFERNSDPRIIIAPPDPHVLVIDPSPFFRMLLTSAIEACGYSVRAIGSLDEAMTECGDVACSLVIWGGAGEFARHRTSSRLAVEHRSNGRDHHCSHV